MLLSVLPHHSILYQGHIFTPSTRSANNNFKSEIFYTGPFFWARSPESLKSRQAWDCFEFFCLNQNLIWPWSIFEKVFDSFFRFLPEFRCSKIPALNANTSLLHPLTFSSHFSHPSTKISWNCFFRKPSLVPWLKPLCIYRKLEPVCVNQWLLEQYKSS